MIPGLNLKPLPSRAPFLYRCRQAHHRIVCGPHGHRTIEAAERCCARLNRELDAIGMLAPDTRWAVEFVS